jgi:hypothetical protein
LKRFYFKTVLYRYNSVRFRDSVVFFFTSHPCLVIVLHCSFSRQRNFVFQLRQMLVVLKITIQVTIRKNKTFLTSYNVALQILTNCSAFSVKGESRPLYKIQFCRICSMSFKNSCRLWYLCAKKNYYHNSTLRVCLLTSNFFGDGFQIHRTFYNTVVIFNQLFIDRLEERPRFRHGFQFCVDDIV